MGEKDKSQKVLEAFNDVFADIVNGLLFDGRPVAQEGEFSDAATWSYYKASGELRDQERDVVKYWKKSNLCISLVGLENQTKKDPYMPIRVMSYDAAEYRAQIVPDRRRKRGRKRRQRRRRICPVLSLVIYLNHKERWRGPITLRQCLEIPREMDPYVHDYRINLFEIAWMSLEEIDRRFHGDFRIIAEYYAQKRINNNYQPRPQAMRHAREVIRMLSVLERDHRFEDGYNEVLRENENLEEGEYTMCEVLDKIENRGIEKGREEGRQEGYRSAQADCVVNMHRKGRSDAEIADNLDLSMVEINAILTGKGLR